MNVTEGFELLLQGRARVISKDPVSSRADTAALHAVGREWHRLGTDVKLLDELLIGPPALADFSRANARLGWFQALWKGRFHLHLARGQELALSGLELTHREVVVGRELARFNHHVGRPAAEPTVVERPPFALRGGGRWHDARPTENKAESKRELFDRAGRILGDLL